MSDLNLAVIGNCSFGALVTRTGKVCWCCLPRFDADPVFCSLLDDGKDQDEQGFFDIDLVGFSHAEQAYVDNTAILKTTLHDSSGSIVEIIDFAPRFEHFDRFFRPASFVRILRPVKGAPRIRIRVRPRENYGAEPFTRVHGSNHIRYLGHRQTFRMTTDVPVSYILEEVPFLLEDARSLMFGVDEPLREPVVAASRDWYEKTLDHWLDWSRSLHIPFEWQEVVIRAAVTLKLCTFEESGAIVAALTTSIPEAKGTVRTWDYRYCWLRDAYFVVEALNGLGATKFMEDYLAYMSNVVAMAEDGRLQPVYGVTLETQLTEYHAESLKGYRGHQPVRIGNQAHEHVQNDVYGSVILAATQAFFDRRLYKRGDLPLYRRLEALGYQCVRCFDQPDSGLWELRGIARVHTYSAAMCWAGCDRLARIATALDLPARADYWRSQADRMHAQILERGFDADRNTFVGSFGGEELDASLLLLHHLQFLPAADSRFVGTVEAVEAQLRRGNHMMRYIISDDFGAPENAFNICTFWMIGALAAVGRRNDALAMFEEMLSCANHVGLLSEDTHPQTGELWGNFPQTYSMVGLIKSAMTLSMPWEEAI